MTWIHTLRATVLLAAVLGWGASCGRTEEPESRPRPAPKAAAPRPKATAAPAPGARPRAACVVPLAEPPPPAARPASRCPEDPVGDFDLPRGAVRFVEAAGKPEVSVELARDPRHRERGLMYRTRMGDGAGMLFSWSDERVRSFWMRNTCLPLDMLFIARDGTIVGILEQVPTLNEAPRSIPCPAMHVLEVNAGWVRAHGVRPGQKVVIDT